MLLQGKAEHFHGFHQCLLHRAEADELNVKQVMPTSSPTIQKCSRSRLSLLSRFRMVCMIRAISEASFTFIFWSLKSLTFIGFESFGFLVPSSGFEFRVKRFRVFKVKRLYPAFQCSDFTTRNPESKSRNYAQI